MVESFLPAEIDKTMSENRALLMGKHVVKILITQVLSNVIYTLFVVMGKRASDF